MRYEPTLYRPPSEARSYILQATIGCSWNRCTYCHMYRNKEFRVRPLSECLEDIASAKAANGRGVDKLFVADGDGLVMSLDHWLPILDAAREAFPRLRQVSCYATADNVLDKTPAELRALRDAGLRLLYMGPESGDETTMRRIAKGPRRADVARDADYLFDAHVEAARRAHEAGLKVSAIFLLGAGGVERTLEHAAGSARLATAMNPAYLAALTLTIVPGTPLWKSQERIGFELPGVEGLLAELRTFVDQARPTDALFRTNHASNYLPLGGRLPADRERIVTTIGAALDGSIPLRPEGSRGL